MADLVVPPAPGIPRGLVIPTAELVERFSRASGPGGQGVNTTDSRVQLSWNVAASAALTSGQRDRALAALSPRLVGTSLTLDAAEQRSQLQNRLACRDRLVALLTAALAPPPPKRRATRPSGASQHRRLEAKRHRAEIKRGRGRPTID